MVSAIASRKYERAALSRLFRFTLAIQPRVQAEHRSDREVTMWECAGGSASALPRHCETGRGGRKPGPGLGQFEP